MAADDGRTRLREAALQLFGRRGVRGTSTRAILEAAGMKNPSAISYHFGSKAELIDDLVDELITDAWPVMQLQVDLAADGTPTVAQWAGVAAGSAAELISTERGCLLARIWWEYDCFLFPDAFDEFLGSDDPLALAWQDAVCRTFPDERAARRAGPEPRRPAHAAVADRATRREVALRRAASGRHDQRPDHGARRALRHCDGIPHRPYPSHR